jgi:hypothetical protein
MTKQQAILLVRSRDPGLVGRVFDKCSDLFEQMLDVLAECFRRGDCRREFPSLRGALAAVDQAVKKIAVSRILSNQSLEALVRTLDLADRYYATGEALEECGRLARTLEIQRYWGDYVL